VIDWNHVLITAAGVIATVAAMRTDIKWLKQSIHLIHKRLDKLEDRE
jgi:hypothetical protein